MNKPTEFSNNGHEKLLANLRQTRITLSTFRGKPSLVTTASGTKRAKPSDLDKQRIRFNWGYHDGAATVRNGYKTEAQIAEWIEAHFDRAYADGFTAGARDFKAGAYDENSAAAWASSGRVDDFEGWRNP